MGVRQQAHSKRGSWRGLRLLVFSALAFSATIALLIFILDVTSDVNFRQVKREGRQAYKFGHTAAEGVTTESAQEENAIAGLLAAIVALMSGVAIRPIVRSRRIVQGTMRRIVGVGMVAGLALILPMRALMIWLVRFII